MFVFYCTVNNSLYVCSFCRDQIFMDFVSFLSMIIYEVLYTWYISDKKLLVDKSNGLKYSENANGAIALFRMLEYRQRTKLRNQCPCLIHILRFHQYKLMNFLLDQINFLLQDNSGNDSTDTVEALGSNTMC